MAADGCFDAGQIKTVAGCRHFAALKHSGGKSTD